MKLPNKIINLQRPLEFFKSYDLHETYGEEFVKYKIFDTETAENICVDMFQWMTKTEGTIKNRGDFVCNGKYFDQKTAQVCDKLPTGCRGEFFKIKYSNVNAKMFIQIVFKELDLIIEDIKDNNKWNSDIHSRLIYIRYKTEMTFDDMWFIDEEIIKGDNVKSFCGRKDMTFLHFINFLCTHNVKKFSHLILFHPPINSKQQYRIEEYEGGYTTYKKHGNYMVTPININQTNIYVDYIGFGGFKVYIPFEKVNKEEIVTTDEDMSEHIKELDESIKISLSVNNFKSLWRRTPWKPTWEDMNTNNWVERYKDEYVHEELWDYQENV
jgi:hypothetical protein